jgi:hypothetical protein
MSDARPRRSVRCTIYTRVSTDAGLEQEFNSLEAQYDASQAYMAGSVAATAKLSRRPCCLLISEALRPSSTAFQGRRSWAGSISISNASAMRSPSATARS